MKSPICRFAIVAGILSLVACSPKNEASVAAPAASSHENGWSTDLEKAFVAAKSENKAVLVEFTGSDWCPPCIAMRKNVFSKPEFINAASKNYVLVELDFPNGDTALKAKNQPYAEKYQIEGFPTVILFTADGKESSRFFASDYPSIELFTKHIDQALPSKSAN